MNFFNLAAGVVIGENFFKIAALLCHIICAVLAHTHAVTVAAHRKGKAAVCVFNAEIKRAQIKDTANFGAVYIGAAHGNG